MRASGVRDVLTYCRDHGCSHSTTVNADRGPDGSSKSMRIEIEAARGLMVYATSRECIGRQRQRLP